MACAPVVESSKLQSNGPKIGEPFSTWIPFIEKYDPNDLPNHYDLPQDSAMWVVNYFDTTFLGHKLFELSVHRSAYPAKSPVTLVKWFYDAPGNKEKRFRNIANILFGSMPSKERTVNGILVLEYGNKGKATLYGEDACFYSNIYLARRRVHIFAEQQNPPDPK